MTENSKPFQSRDELLAAFTDHALAGGEPQIGPVIPEDDSELRALAETVLRVKDVFGSDGPDEAEAARMHARIMSAWKKRLPEQEGGYSWLQRLAQVFKPKSQWRSQRSLQRSGLALAFALAAVFLLVMMPFVSSAVATTPGSAGMHPAGIASLAFAAILIAVVVWWARRKK